MTTRRALHIFRRDLRLSDNTALLAAMKRFDSVLPCFIFDPRQVGPHAYRSEAALQFMLESLEDLQSQLVESGGRLFCFFGRPEEVVTRLIETGIAQAVFYNRDYTPFSRERDAALKSIARERSVVCEEFDDALLNPPGAVLKSDGKPYTVFTPFFRAAGRTAVAEPVKLAKGKFYTGEIEFEFGEAFSRLLESSKEGLFAKGGRREALRILSRAGEYSTYKEQRDFPSLAGTTGLSPHLKFGTCSVREAYYALKAVPGSGQEILRQLYWRDFFVHIAWHFPHVFGRAFHPRYDGLEWHENVDFFERWCRGETGFPIIDAGMRELNNTGYMHNRVRMLVSSFLMKDLHIDWRKGEKYFATKLIDYDPAVNNGNWQWAASTGCDAQPWFRIFNPWLQQKKFDPEALYIKRWVPELRELTSAQIHGLSQAQYPTAGYPVPCVDHMVEKSITEDLFEAVR